MEEALEITISDCGDILIPWHLDSFDLLISELADILGMEDSTVQRLFGPALCG